VDSLISVWISSAEDSLSFSIFIAAAFEAAESSVVQGQERGDSDYCLKLQHAPYMLE
jgi:hypothetical protein